MKNLKRQYALCRKILFYLPSALMILFIARCRKLPDLPSAKITTITSRLQSPIGLERKYMGGGTRTADNDGKLF